MIFLLSLTLYGTQTSDTRVQDIQLLLDIWVSLRFVARCNQRIHVEFRNEIVQGILKLK